MTFIPFDSEYARMAEHLILAAAAGGIIGLERSYHGRPAGFRTHTLVCMASALLMLLTVYQYMWFQPHGLERTTLDPTRMAQGIMTGIGFLGAGVIMKDGLSVRGLTTAASIWITAAIGVLMGVGFYIPAGLAIVLTLGTLSLFRWIEMRMPMNYFGQFTIRFLLSTPMEEKALRALVSEHGFSIAGLSYRFDRGDRGDGYFEYRMSIRTINMANWQRLAESLQKNRTVHEFRLSPTGD
jgi:putative Mg2+ transporter-C (MgtC) family protein